MPFSNKLKVQEICLFTFLCLAGLTRNSGTRAWLH